jgi:hypothetical protein
VVITFCQVFAAQGLKRCFREKLSFFQNSFKNLLTKEYVNCNIRLMKGRGMKEKSRSESGAAKSKTENCREKAQKAQERKSPFAPFRGPSICQRGGGLHWDKMTLNRLRFGPKSRDKTAQAWPIPVKVNQSESNQYAPI